MKDLAEEMGVELFVPEGRGIKLTAAGKAFAERARSVLASVDAAVDEAKGIAEGRLGTVTQLEPMSSVEQWAALREGAIAFGFGAYAPDDDDLGHLEMSRDRLGLLLSSEHRLAQRKRLRLKDLEDERVLLQPRHLYPRLRTSSRQHAPRARRCG